MKLLLTKSLNNKTHECISKTNLKFNKFSRNDLFIYMNVQGIKVKMNDFNINLLEK